MAMAAELQKHQRRSRKATARVKALEAEVATLRERVATAEQAAANQHSAMARQDHIHAEEIAAIHAKLDRVLAAWSEILKRAQP